MTQPGPLRLVISDVDGTIVTGDKQIAPSTIDAAARLQAAGIALSIVSARPSRGMLWIQQALKLTGPLAGFNGGRMLGPDGRVIAEHAVPEPAARTALALFAARGIQTWIFCGDDWFVRDAHAPHVERESHTVRYQPTEIEDFEPHMGSVSKMVGVSDDAEMLAGVEAELQTLIGDAAHAKRSQTYYLDLTAQDANKGAAVRAIAEAQGVAIDEVAVVGDMLNDVPMFEVAGFSVAMGNATDDVKAHASAAVDATNDHDGWAEAVDKFFLPRAAK